MKSRTALAASVDACLQAFGRVDILVNNAGIYEFSPLEGVTEEQFYKHFDLNVLGLIFASQQAVKHIGSAGGSMIFRSGSPSGEP